VPASKRSANRATELELDRVHPLLLTHAVPGEVEVGAYIAGLGAFRPQQTIMELEGGGGSRTGGGRKKQGGAPRKLQALPAQSLSTLMRAKRAMHERVLQPRVGSVVLGAAVMACAKGSGAVEEGTVGRKLAGEIAGVCASLGDKIEDMVARHKERQAKAERLEETSASERGLEKEEEEEEEEGRGGKMGRRTGGAFDEEEETDDGNDGVSFADTFMKSEFGGGMNGKRRLSAAVKRKLARAKGVQKPASETLAPPASSTLAAPHITKSQRRALLRDAGLDAAKDLFKDSQHFISLRSAAEIVNEAGFSAEGTLGSRGEGKRGRMGAGDLDDLTRLEDAAMDMAGDEKSDLAGLTGGGKQKRVRYWDPVKKRYLQIDASEIGAGGKRKISAVRNEAGAKVGKSKEKKKDGESYAEWLKSTRNRSGGGGGGADDEEPSGVVEFNDEEEGEEGEGSAGKKRPGASKGVGGAPISKQLRTAKQISQERARKGKGQGKFASKSKKKSKWGEDGAPRPSLGKFGKIKTGGSAAPRRSKVLVRGSGITGFKTAGKGRKGR